MLSTDEFLNVEGFTHTIEKIKSITSTYIYEQGVAANIWEINHNMGKFPSVTVVDSAGSVVIGAIEYIDINNLKITFNSSFGGKAYLN